MVVKAGKTQQFRERLGQKTLFSPPPAYTARVYAPDGAAPPPSPNGLLRVATYNVHKWTGLTGGRRLDAHLAAAVIEELEADVIALQEVLRPEDGTDPLEEIAEALGLHAAFVPTRLHRQGELGNAILARWPIRNAFAIDLSFSRLEQRSALAAQFHDGHDVAVVATHLALVDRTRKQQVRSLLEHPELQGAVVLMGDMNAWRRCRATRTLDAEFVTLHDNQNWPPSYPATRPVLALDRIYARNAHVKRIRAHDSTAARRASDHLPIVASIAVENGR